MYINSEIKFVIEINPDSYGNIISYGKRMCLIKDSVWCYWLPARSEFD